MDEPGHADAEAIAQGSLRFVNSRPRACSSSTTVGAQVAKDSGSERAAINRTNRANP